MVSKLFHSIVVIGTTMATGLTVGAVGALTACSSNSTPDAHLGQIDGPVFHIDAAQGPDAHVPDANLPGIAVDGGQHPDANLVTIMPNPGFADARVPDANLVHISPGPGPADARPPDANLVAIMPAPGPRGTPTR